MNRYSRDLTLTAHALIYAQQPQFEIIQFKVMFSIATNIVNSFTVEFIFVNN